MPKEKPNILFLLIDSLNSKNCLENDKTSITPNIDSLIKNGVCFDQTISCASTTVPSICSMFTGTYPFNSIVVEETLYKLNTQIQNFIQILERDGYSVSGFIPDVIKHIDLEHIFHSKLETFDSFSTTYDILGEKIVRINMGLAKFKGCKDIPLIEGLNPNNFTTLADDMAISASSSELGYS